MPLQHYEIIISSEVGPDDLDTPVDTAVMYLAQDLKDVVILLTTGTSEERLNQIQAKLKAAIKRKRLNVTCEVVNTRTLRISHG